MIALQRLLPERCKAVAVSEKRGESTDDKRVVYREHSFQTLRGFLDSLSKSTTFICLDWFWLQQGYYARYGLDWVTSKIPAAFEKCPRLVSVVLPLESWSACGGGLREMLNAPDGIRALARSGLTAVHLSWEEATVAHPMVRATTAAAAARGRGGGCLTDRDVQAERRHVDATHPFVAFVRAGTHTVGSDPRSTVPCAPLAAPPAAPVVAGKAFTREGVETRASSRRASIFDRTGRLEPENARPQ